MRVSVLDHAVLTNFQKPKVQLQHAALKIIILISNCKAAFLWDCIATLRFVDC